MGMPACRISDSTAHGGIVVVGFPQVMIGYLPASRIGDLHTCPMVTGVVPHVGGPFILGSPTVHVGMMPQSRVTDQLTCVGPPDVAIKGEVTVLVGMAGAGGAAGASGGIAAMGAPVPPAAPAGAAASGSTKAGGGSGGGAQGGTSQGGGATGGGASTSATLQKDGTTKTAATGGDALPPIALKQEGWPDLPPENTATFNSVQPANVLPGTTLYASVDGGTAESTSYWSADPPVAGVTKEDAWNAGTHVLVHTVPPGPGVKAWAGEGAETGKLQLWAPPGSMGKESTQRLRMPGKPA